MTKRIWPVLPKGYFFRLSYWMGSTPRIELRKKTFLGFSVQEKWNFVDSEWDIKYYSERWARDAQAESQVKKWFEEVLKDG